MSPLDRRSVSPVWLWVVVFVLMLIPIGTSISVQAQDDTPAATTTEQAQPEVVQESALWWIIKTSGWIGAFILLISIYFVTTVVLLFMEMKPSEICPPELMEQCEGLLQRRDFNGIYKTVKEHPSELGQLLSVGMSGLSTGIQDASDAIDRHGEAIAVNLEKKISMLAVIGSLGPLIGLLGTLKGMIASFSVIARSDTQLKASEVAGGISEALLLTFEGVSLSVPAIYFYALFKNRVSTLTVETINTAEEFIRRVFAAAQKKTSAKSASSAEQTA